jgi:UDP-N-acetylmuramate--alanine ligase
VVVTSTAVKTENPEVREAHRKNIPVIPRAEMLAELLKMKFSVAVSGSHGKTTTTSMISTILAQGGLDPTMVIGGKLASIGSNARLGDGEIIVAEADESDGSFLKLSPTIAVITNIDREHLDFYPGITEIKEAFLKFANIVPFYGCTVICSDNIHVREITPLIKRKMITYGIELPADYSAREIKFLKRKTTYSLFYKGTQLGMVELTVPGLFNVYNSLAAIAVARELNLNFATIKEGLQSFSGVQRRLEIKGRVGDITVVDDYGHHPTEIKATLTAMRQIWKDRLIVVFQPHRFTRTRALFDEFTKAFGDADILIMNDIYPASEEPISGINSAALCEAIRQSGQTHVKYISKTEDIIKYLLKTVKAKDTVATLGAGSIYKIGEAFLKQLAGKEKK